MKRLKLGFKSGILANIMPAVQRSEFALALNQVSNERGLDPAIVLETVKNAILAAYRKDHPGMELEEYTATLDANTGEAKIFNKNKDVTPPGFGRIAAQTAKQVIPALQWIFILADNASGCAKAVAGKDLEIRFNGKIEYQA